MLRLTFLLAFTCASLARADDGVLCVARLPPQKQPFMPTAHGKVADAYLVRVDAGAWAKVDGSTGARFEGLAREKRHLVEIAIGDRTIESFPIRFPSRGQLRLALKPGYFTWGLSDSSCAA
ncbi:MAG: hypothetical protein ACOZQL_39675 [Myxococcota bacterium]